MQRDRVDSSAASYLFFTVAYCDSLHDLYERVVSATTVPSAVKEIERLLASACDSRTGLTTHVVCDNKHGPCKVCFPVRDEILLFHFRRGSMLK